MEKSEELKHQINNYILTALAEENFKQNLKNTLVYEIKYTLLVKRDSLLKDENYLNIKSKIKAYITDMVNAKNFKQEIYSFIDSNLKALEGSNRTLDTIIPPTVLNSVKVYIYNHKDEIVATLKDFINNENMDKKIYNEINSVLNNINPMVARFINTNSIYTKLKTSINEYLDNPKNIMDIINMINSQLDAITKKKISEFTANFPAEGRKSIINSISNGIVSNILSEGFIDKTINMLEERLLIQLTALSKNPEKLHKDIENIIDKVLVNYYNRIINDDKTKELIDELSSNLVSSILEKPLKDFLE